MKYKAIVKVKYQFEFETDKTNRKDIETKAEGLWENFVSFGLECEKYHDTEIDIRECD